MNGLKKIRRHYVFYGRVQGVGFRWRASKAAVLLEIGGWIKNNCDGSVEMEAEGYESALDKLIFILKDNLYIDIERTDAIEIPVENSSCFQMCD